ncbi:MAG: bifunctional diaminohydroxyphosphoribosylaminopyrimidine deaminase/5-amino-6-(5-phosphoribosylamino)uracil reductase RibD [Thalassobaculales bacterium]
MSGPVFSAADHAHMAAALSLARRGLGQTAPNPAVGCVLVRDGIVLARGWTQPGGRPHAEAEALRRAGPAARGATAYVTLEPCAHHGRTPPCAEALVAAGVARVVAALEDPDPRVAGRGFAILRQAGIRVDSGLLAAEARFVNEGFLLRLSAGRPLVTLKLATSLDGRIALADGQSRWITGPAARAAGHLLRAEHDAVMVGIGTALADDPRLTVRLPGLAAAPRRVVVDSRLRLPPGAAVLEGGGAIVLTAAAGSLAGAQCLRVAAGPGGIDLAEGLRALASLGLTRVLVEGGGALAAGLLRAGLVDRLAVFRAGLAIGAEGRPALGPLGLASIAEGPRFRLHLLSPLGGDVLETWTREA